MEVRKVWSSCLGRVGNVSGEKWNGSNKVLQGPIAPSFWKFGRRDNYGR